MQESDAYYEEILYPLQSGVLSTLAACGAPFYLTGGTALHRHYFGFRYSDDLDFFVNQDTGFDGHVDRALAALRERDYRFDGEAFLRTDQYARVLITADAAALKLDFVNDSAPRFGPVVSGGLFPRIDSLRNILSNKVTAVYRLESKDIADLWAVCTPQGIPLVRRHGRSKPERGRNRCSHRRGSGALLPAAPVRHDSMARATR